MASGVTSYQTTDHRMNFSYIAGKSGYDAQIRVHYNTSRLNSSTVRAKIDVEVYYDAIGWASTNCCAVFLDGSGTGQMLNQTCQKGNCANFANLGTNRLYASHPATSKTQYTGSAGTWITKDYSVSYNKTSFTVTVYFCNTMAWGNYPTNIWNAASSYPLTFTIPCEVGYTSAGNPGAPTRNAQWFEGKCSFSWSAAANGTNNSVTGYDWIIDRSSSAGGTSGWTQIASGSTSSGTRTCTSPSISTAYRGYNFRCRVKTKATYGSYSYRNGTSYSRYNYAPSISGTYVSFGATSGSYVQCGSSVTAKGGSDSGGYASGSTLQYNLNINGTWTGYSTSSSNSGGCTWSSKLTTFGGRLISFQVRVYDGFTTTTSGTISKAIGSNLVNTFSFGTGTLSYTTSFNIPKSTVDGYNFATGVTEHLTLSAKKSSSTVYTEIYSGIRSGSSLTSSRNVTGILASLIDAGIVDLKDQSGNAQTINFKLEIRITDNSNPTHCHLTKTITGSRTYTNWVINNWLSHPDGNITYKFPFDSGIPITTSTFRINWEFDSYPAGQLNNGTLRRHIYYKSLNSASEWIHHSQKLFEDSTAETGYEDFAITDFTSRGNKFEILVTWDWYGYKVCEDPSIKWKWDYSEILNEDDQKTIYYRPYPTLHLSSTSFTDAQMLTPNVAENRIVWDTGLTMEDDGRLMKIKKAYLTIYELNQEWDSAEIPLNTIIGSGGGNMELSHTYSNWYRITDNIDNNLQYHRLSYSLYNEDNPNVENGGENESATFSVNGSYRLVQAFDFCELYRATPTGTLSGTLYESDLRTHNVLAELSFDMISVPYFDVTNKLTWSRYNYSSSN